MVLPTQGLPVGLVREPLQVSLMRNDVVYHFRLAAYANELAFLAARMGRKEAGSSCAPAPIIPAKGSGRTCG